MLDDDSKNGVTGDALAPEEKATQEIIRRLKDRGKLMSAATNIERLQEGAAVVLQEGAADVLQEGAADLDEGDGTKRVDPAKSWQVTSKDVMGAVNYRLAITDLFVEKAQYHLEKRADVYVKLGIYMYIFALLLFGGGALLAVFRMIEHDQPVLVAVVSPAVAGATQSWIELLRRFMLAFTAYGFVVLTAVALARGARACLDQRERLLAKRHSLRQGRLYLHLTGGNVTIEDMERAFNWNHEQQNAFTHLPTEARAPWGAVLEEVVKLAPELVKAGVTATRTDTEKRSPADRKNQKGAAGATSLEIPRDV